MINRRLSWYLETSNFLNPAQSAFRKTKCTVDNLAILHSDIMEAYASRKSLTAVFFDLKKAYDCVHGNTLLRKLNDIGIKGNMIAFISNFLSNRKFRCMIGECSTYLCQQENGVPQGSVLSVTLFLIAINDILLCTNKNVKGLLYADDLVIYCSGKKDIPRQRKIQGTLNKLETWCNNNGFQFNTEKTTAVNFSRKK